METNTKMNITRNYLTMVITNGEAETKRLREQYAELTKQAMPAYADPSSLIALGGRLAAIERQIAIEQAKVEVARQAIQTF